jgi:hypothetical protein
VSSSDAGLIDWVRTDDNIDIFLAGIPDGQGGGKRRRKTSKPKKRISKRRGSRTKRSHRRRSR